MEGSFLKKIRDEKAEAIRAAQQELERVLPSPPGMSIDEIEKATPVIVQYMEQYVAGKYIKDDDDDFIFKISNPDIRIPSLVHPNCYYTVYSPLSTAFDGKSEWWSAICDWSRKYYPTPQHSTLYAGRYEDLVYACYKMVKNMWKHNHPDIPVSMTSAFAIRITIPEKEEEEHNSV